MNIGLIIFSHTGNTLSVAQKLQEKLAAAGHKVNLERIEISGSFSQGGNNFRITASPDPGAYDAVVFGAPVMAFSLSPVMKRYLPQIASLQGKKVALLTTEFFLFPWMGGNRAIRVMKKICESKGATVCGSGVVNWSRRGREEQIVNVVDNLEKAF